MDLPLILLFAGTCVAILDGTAPGTSATRVVYLQTVVGVSVGAIAFAITGASILFAVTPGPRLRSVMQKAGYQLARLIMISVVTLIWAAGTLSFAIMLEGDPPWHYLVPLELTLTVLGILVQLRLTWLLFQVFGLLALEKSAGN